MARYGYCNWLLELLRLCLLNALLSIVYGGFSFCWEAAGQLLDSNAATILRNPILAN